MPTRTPHRSKTALLPLLSRKVATACLLLLTLSLPALADKSDEAARVYGKIQVVDSFPDYKVKVVESFPDLKVKKVDAFADSPGEWEMVNSFPDFKIQFVDSFPDFTIQWVDSFPGPAR